MVKSDCSSYTIGIVLAIACAGRVTILALRNTRFPVKLVVGLSSFTVFVLLFLWYIGVFGGNVHTVVPGKVYRSAQLTGSNLDTVLTQDHIATEINLRGGDMSKAWYKSELQLCQEHGTKHYDITMSARSLPTPTKMAMLLNVLDTAPYPVLIHCSAGADRTGLACTLYENVYQHVPLDQAEDEQLTWHHGHFWFGATHAMNDFFNLYRSTGDGMSLREWILKRYPAVYKTATA